MSSRRSTPRTKNTSGFETAIVITCAVITWTHPAAQIGSLKALTQIPIVMDGKAVGTTTLPAGTKVISFARHSVPQRIAALLKSGRTVIIPNGKTEFVSISPKKSKRRWCSAKRSRQGS